MIVPVLILLSLFFWPAHTEDHIEIISGKDEEGPVEEYSRMSSLTIWEQLKSNEFILFVMYFIIMMLWINTYFGTVERRIADYTLDQEKGIFIKT